MSWKKLAGKTAQEIKDIIDGSSLSSLSIDGRPVTGGLDQIDKATAFDGSDGESTSLTKVTASNGVLSLGTIDGTTANRPGDNATYSRSSGRGLVINPNTDLGGVEVTLSSNMGTVQDVALVNTSETLLDEQTGGYSAGDTVQLTASLSAGTDYYVVTYDNGNSYDDGTLEFPSDSPPYTSSDIDITAGISGAHPDDGDSPSEGTDYIQSFVDVKALTAATSGTATVEWSHPDVSSWTRAMFQRTLDSETVDVYIEYDDGSGWTTANSGNPISRGFDLSSIAASSEVRFRVELSRDDTSNNPTCDLLAREYVL